MKNIEILISQIGKKSTYELLQLAQNELRKQHESLLNYLENKEWVEAKKIAHDLIATSNLYATSELTNLYKMIKEDSETIVDILSFVEELKLEIEKSNSKISEIMLMCKSQ